VRFHNTLTRRKEEFHPIARGAASIYSCGPTVYRDVHIGNLRTYLMADWLRRALIRCGYSVRHVKNITDVGHMRTDMLERGEDKVIAAAIAAGKTSAEIAEHYTRTFLDAERDLNILPADVLCKATEHVPHMLALIERLEQRGLTYAAGGNVYFSVAALPEYGKLSGNQGGSLLEGVRVEQDPDKRDPRDFALWKGSEAGRAMSWPSKWGEGFPGWHIECSAMSMHHLGERFDFHTGGVDNIFPHHEDEIAQSEGAVGHEVVGTWLHGQHLLVDGVKMAKSTGNSYTIEDVKARGYDPLALRYLCLGTHYRKRLNFTWEALRAAASGLNHLRREVSLLSGAPDAQPSAEWCERFDAAIADDLGLPAALATAWNVVRAGLSPGETAATLRAFDEVLGLNLMECAGPAPAAVVEIAERRAAARASGRFDRADEERKQIESAGWHARDGRESYELVPLLPLPPRPTTVNSSAEVASTLDQPPELAFSVVVISRDDLDAVRRCVDSVLAHAPPATEVIVVDNASPPDVRASLEALALERKVRAVFADHNLGTAAARNIGTRLATGEVVAYMDTSVVLTGDALTPLAQELEDARVGLAGGWGVNTQDMREFEDAPGPDVDAVEGYLMAFRRERVREIGPLDEKYRFYRHLDLDYSLAFRAAGYRNRIVAGLPAERHGHSEWYRIPPEERERLSKRNFYRFLNKYGHSEHLLLAYAEKA
jgi:cysteinyl-tRNA synthetase